MMDSMVRRQAPLGDDKCPWAPKSVLRCPTVSASCSHPPSIPLNHLWLLDTDVVDPLKWQDMLEDSILRGSTEASSSQSNRVPAGTASGRHSHYIDTHSRLVHTPMPQTTSERTVKREPSLPSVSSHPSWVPANPDANTASNVRRRVEHSLNGGTAEHGMLFFKCS